MDERKNLFTGTIAIIALAFVIASSLPIDARAGSKEKRGDGRVTLYRPIKDERATFKYRDSRGRYDEAVMADIARFFRCRLTDDEHEIDPRLIEILDAIEDHFDAREIRLISAYRSPERNARMRRQGKRVAKESLHMQGQAADIEVPGVSKQALRDFAYSLEMGGVGYYSRRSFVHVDTGDLRAWGFNTSKKRYRTRPASAHK